MFNICIFDKKRCCVYSIKLLLNIFLIFIQSSDGHFIWGVVISTYTDKSKDELMTQRPDFVSNDDVWITAIVISMLEAMKDEEELWELVVRKAKAFLSKMLNGDQVERLLTAAAKLI